MENIDVEQYIKDNYTDANPIPFEEVGIEIKKSAQVRIKTQKDEDYYEIGSQSVSSKDELTVDDLKKQTKANSGSLENQRLMVGDVLITIRAQFKYAKVITEELLSPDLSVVAVKGHIILRTNDIKKAQFLKFYLERDEIRNFINNHQNAKAPNGKYAIEPNVIRSVLLPDTVVKKDLTHFLQNSTEIQRVVTLGTLLTERLDDLSNKHREKFCRIGIEQQFSDDLTLWKEFGKELKELIKASMGGEADK